MTDTAPETEFVPIAEVEIEMTAGELRAALAAHQPAHDVAKLVERLRHPVAEHWPKDAADAANLIDRQRAEIERLGREKYDLTIELEAAKEIIRRLEARWQVAQADYRAVMQAIGCESIAEVPDKLRAAERERDEAYRKGQEDMRARAAHVSEPVSLVAARFVRALEIKEAPDADAGKEGGADPG